MPPPPLIHSMLGSEQQPTPAEISAAVKGALMQWGRAFSHFTEKRRLNVLSSILSGSVHLLDDKKSFSWKQTMKSLFGQHLIDSMVSSAKTDMTFASLHPKKVASKKTYNTRSRGSQGDPWQSWRYQPSPWRQSGQWVRIF